MQPKLQVSAKADAKKAEMVLYGTIGSSWFEEGITAKMVSDALASLPSTVNEITVRINSGGGDVFEGFTIYNRLKQHKAKKIVYIDGLAASIASVIALAGDEVIIGEGGFYMVHLPWTWTSGNRIDLDEVSNRLVAIEDQLINVYVKKTKKDREEVRAMLVEERWLNGDEAIEHGFVDRKDGEALPVAASALDAPWIRRSPPKGLAQAEAKVVSEEVKNLLKKIDGTLARK